MATIEITEGVINLKVEKKDILELLKQKYNFPEDSDITYGNNFNLLIQYNQEIKGDKQ